MGSKGVKVLGDDGARTGTVGWSEKHEGMGLMADLLVPN